MGNSWVEGQAGPLQAPEGSGERRDGGRGLLQGRGAAQLRLTPQASFGRSRAARGAALGLAVCVGQGERRLLLGSWAEGPALSSSLLISSLAPSCSQSDPGSQIGRAVTAGCWLLAASGAHTTVGFHAPPRLPPPLWGKGCRAASDWPGWEKGGGGAGRVDACVCFQFQGFFSPLSFFSPKFLVFLLFPLLTPSRRPFSQDVRGCLKIPQPTPAASR